MVAALHEGVFPKTLILPSRSPSFPASLFAQCGGDLFKFANATLTRSQEECVLRCVGMVSSQRFRCRESMDPWHAPSEKMHKVARGPAQSDCHLSEYYSFRTSVHAMCMYTEVELACGPGCPTVCAHDQGCKVKEVIMKCMPTMITFRTAGQFPTNDKVIVVKVPTTAQGSHTGEAGSTILLGKSKVNLSSWIQK